MQLLKLLIIAAVAAASAGAVTAAPGADPAIAIPGVTEPLMDVTLSSPAQGTVRERKFAEGDAVEKGAVLLELDSTLEQLEVERKKVVAERNRTDYESTQVLFDKTKAVSKEELQKKQMEYKVAVAEWEIAKEQLKRRVIVAPFDGSIVEFYLQPGAGCEPYQPLVRMVQTKQCLFIGHLDGVAATGLKLGQPVKIDIAGKQSVNGKLSFIAPVADSASGLVRVKAIFENGDNAVRPGLSATLSVQP